MKLTLLSTSDVHGYIYPTNFSQKEMDLPFGFAKAATAIKELRADGTSILIENGDFIQGSPLSYYIAKRSGEDSPAPLIGLPNTLGYDVGVLGNHEFNYGSDYLRKAVAAANYPILCANILNQDGQPAFGKAYEIFEKDGVKVAILGLTTSYIPNWEHPLHIAGLTFRSALETAQEIVPKLKELADIVVVSYHGGFERDLETGAPTEALTGENEGYLLATEVPGVDALITGHQHREIATHVNGIPVTQPGFRGAKIGKIVLEIEERAGHYQVINSTADLIEAAGYTPDQQVLDMMESYEQGVENWLDEPLGKVEGNMKIEDHHQARVSEHPYIELINKVQMKASGANISGAALFNNEGTGFDEIITMRDVVTNYIYPNTLAVERVTGAELKAALERSASFFAIEEDGSLGINPDFIVPKPQYYNYDMYEGIHYTMDIRKPMGSRVTELKYRGKSIQDQDSLEVVLNQYRAVGGGDYTMFSADKIVREVQIDMTDLIAEYLMENPVIQAETNDNFKVIY